jgi:thioredoxin reductase (NADPH)
MRRHAQSYGARLTRARALRLEPAQDARRIITNSGEHLARTVLLATRATNRRPAMECALQEEAVARGRIRYCPVCDGYEVTDRNVAVIGDAQRGAREAEFLLSFTSRVTLVTAQDEPHRRPRRAASSWMRTSAPV